MSYNVNTKAQEDNIMSSKLLIVEDDSYISEMVQLYLTKEGYDIKIASDGVEAISLFKMYEPDLVLLDIMLPRKDGWAVCKEIRQISSIPIIMVTAKGEVFDKVLGLELGADDFMVKPFDMKELSARVKAVLRRYNSHDTMNDDEVIKFENIEISLQKYELKLNGNVRLDAEITVECNPDSISLTALKFLRRLGNQKPYFSQLFIPSFQSVFKVLYDPVI